MMRHFAETVFGQTREANALESMCAVALKTESTMTEHTCVGSALATLNANRQTNIFKTQVEETQVTLDNAVKANE